MGRRIEPCVVTNPTQAQAILKPPRTTFWEPSERQNLNQIRWVHKVHKTVKTLINNIRNRESVKNLGARFAVKLSTAIYNVRLYENAGHYLLFIG